MRKPAIQSKPAETRAATFVTGGARYPEWFLAVLLVAATILAYQPVWHAGFIWDDGFCVTKPELRSFHGLARIWTELGATQQYYPLVHTVFWMEHRIWGDSTAPYHCVNILLHAISALLVVKILKRLEVPGAWLAAALFALHPVQVESVAWVAEFKNTFSGVFYFSAALAFLGYDRKRSPGQYVLALGLFVLGLMSKTAVATLPAALLVVLWWKRGELGWKRDVLALMPFFAAGMGGGLLTAWVERRFVGAEGAVFHFSMIERCLIAGRGIWFYLGKLCWPGDLLAVYPRWNVSQTAWWQYMYPAAALVLVGVLVRWRWRGPLAALLYFAGTLFPALGFVNVYYFRYSFVADHFQYLACLGPLALAAAGMSAAGSFIWKREPMAERILCAGLLLALGAMTWKECGMYANSETLWRTTLLRNPECWVAHSNYGAALDGKGDMEDAIQHYQESIRLNPDYAPPHYNLGTALGRKGKIDEAIREFREAISLKPDFAEAHNNLGSGLAREGKMEEAIREFREAIRLKPDYEEAGNNLAHALRTKDVPAGR